MVLKNKTFGFIGGGQMCEAIASGMAASGEISSSNITILDISSDRLDFLKEKYNFNTVLSNESGQGISQIADNCDVIILAIKPQQSQEILPILNKSIPKTSLVISIMGGITLDFLKEHLPNNKVIRVMPNTPMLVRKGVAGMAVSNDCTDDDIQIGKSLFDLVGITYIVSENMIDSLTSVSGCSPAFVYMFIEAMSDGGVEKGLPRDMAIKMAAQAVAGAAEMVLQTGIHPAQLKDSVTSPGGGTIAGVHALEDGNFRSSVINAVTKSCDHMIEVGRKSQSK